MGILSLALTVIILVGKKHSVYCAICLGLTVFFGLFMLDIAVLIRWGDGVKYMADFSLSAEYHRLIYGGAVRWTEMLANVAVFLPFGFFLSEFLSSTKSLTPHRWLGFVVLCSFCFSLCIEFLQLILRLGVCEVTDSVLNTLGGLIGASLSVVVRIIWERGRKKRTTAL